MAHPKRKTSKQRRNTRRSVQKIKPVQITTGEHEHLYHHAYWVKTEEAEELRYRGRVLLVKKNKQVNESEG